MRRILCAAACVLGLSLAAGVAEARPIHGQGFHGGHVRHIHAGPRFSPGGRWGYRVWSPIYHRYHYWDAGRCCFYYYNPVSAVYVPCP